MEMFVMDRLDHSNGNPVTVISMSTVYDGHKYRSTAELSNGTIRISYGVNAQTSERNALRGLNVDWSRLLPY